MRGNHPILVFFGLTFLISGATALPLVASVHGLLPVRLPRLLGPLAALGPGLAALVTASMEDGWKGLRRLVGSAGKWRVPFRCYVVAVLYPPLLLGATFTVNSLLGGAFPPVLQRLPHFLAVLLVSTLQAGVGEELGWRGFAQRRLQSHLGPLLAAIGIGLVWSVWHLPLFLIPGSMQAQLRHAVGLLPAIGGYSGYLLLTAVLYALVMNASDTVLMPILMHGVTNATAWLFWLNEVETQGVRPMLLLTALQGVVVMGWVIAQRMRPDSPRRLTRARSRQAD